MVLTIIKLQTLLRIGMYTYNFSCNVRRVMSLLNPIGARSGRNTEVDLTEVLVGYYMYDHKLL